MKDVLQALHHRLNYYKELGIKHIPKVKKDIMKKNSAHETLEDIRTDIGDCTRCKLHAERTHIVFGEGNPKAKLMFIGEGPGHDEDITGRPFVGRAGQLLTKIIEAMKLKRSDVYIANIVKCRPQNNRAPEADEVAICEGFLHRQIAVIKPKVIVCLGSVAAQNLLKTEKKISALRGNWISLKETPVMPTYHPAFLLRNPNMKKAVWEDMKKVMEFFKKEDNKK
ncbi:MAG TPA: uracil-DNA glycosylase [Deltaproteobacteria bacterium]|nr:uracil-DNA glycosylase [Deltaproteobacteria bacterium]